MGAREEVVTGPLLSSDQGIHNPFFRQSYPLFTHVIVTKDS
jgi:hypothetical protein